MLDEPYEPKTIDAFAQELWEREGVYRFDPQAPGEVFSVDTPPPTVSGSLHVGHVFSYTQAECIVRFQRMRGRNVFYPFGFDDNGLPTERLAEKEHGVLGRELPREEFVRLCRETAARYEAEFETLWRSLGISADWSLRYGTIDERCIRISQRGFLDLLDEPRSTTQLAALTGLPLGAVGNHLRVLLDAGAVLRRRSGREVLYWRTALGDDLVAAGQ